ncbi:hypothetical protein N7495_002960 [Penicillium taxi]|uniref:uncharacterized protein n=1 Tax=Penicillium taxi TaxID=168475 RepID=UPI00254564BB|nr:uncharacterized protein N7495_002960 [Penicillium taxi]KAJ5902432.1 hypothetical protein N7495_002960 [Penicillium taxi]
MFQLRQIARQGDRVRLSLSPSLRQFSNSRAISAEGQNQPSGPSDSKTRQTATTPRKSRPANKPPGSPAQNRPRPARVLDARSFAATSASGEQPKVIRKPWLRNARGGVQTKGKPKPAAKKARKPRSRGPRTFESEDGEELTAASIEQVEKDQIMKARPTPIRYEPKDIDFSTLKETWPSLPTSVNARSAAVLEKLTSLSGRFPNGYVPPYELGRRLWNGQNVLFESETEKAEALEEVKRLSQARADKISQRTGDLVEPSEITFNAVNAKDTKILLETLAQGKYPGLEGGKTQPSVFENVIKNLRNNGTYETTGKRPQFLAKVESLIASSRIKRN